MAQSIPKPSNSLDWLAQIPEKGQTVQDYAKSLTLRPGRLKSNAREKGIAIDVPAILVDGDLDEATTSWQNQAPRLEALMQEVTKAFFSRPVEILAPAVVPHHEVSVVNKNPAEAFAAKSKFSIRFVDPGADGVTTLFETSIQGRHDFKTNFSQLEVTSVLDQLSAYRKKQTDKQGGGDFCVMGVTMEDLYHEPKDLFCAGGMASSGTKVAVFLFYRYHHQIRMNLLKWYDYGFQKRSDDNSYFDEQTKRPSGLMPCPPA